MNALEVEPYTLRSVASERWETEHNHVKLIKYTTKFLAQLENILPETLVLYVPRGMKRTGEGEVDKLLRLVRIIVLFFLPVSGNVMKQFMQAGLSYVLRSMGVRLPPLSYTVTNPIRKLKNIAYQNIQLPDKLVFYKTEPPSDRVTKSHRPSPSKFVVDAGYYSLCPCTPRRVDFVIN